MSSSSVDTGSLEKEQPVLRELVKLLRGIRFGTVVLTVHDGRVVEIHRTEKIRVPSPRNP